MGIIKKIRVSFYIVLVSNSLIALQVSKPKNNSSILNSNLLKTVGIISLGTAFYKLYYAYLKSLDLKQSSLDEENYSEEITKKNFKLLKKDHKKRFNSSHLSWVRRDRKEFEEKQENWYSKNRINI